VRLEILATQRLRGSKGGHTIHCCKADVCTFARCNPDEEQGIFLVTSQVVILSELLNNLLELQGFMSRVSLARKQRIQ